MELIIGREAGASRLRISINNQDRFWGNANSVPKSVSRQHCKVVTDDKGGYIITNLKPENVTSSMVCKSSPSTFPEKTA